MSVLDRFLDAIKLNDDYDDDYLDDEYMDDEDDFLDDDYEDKPKRKFFDKFARKKSSESDDDYLDQDLYEPSDKLNAKTTKSNSTKQTVYAKDDKGVKTDKAAKAPISSKITPMRSSKRSASGSSMEVCVIKPSSMEDTSEIADSLKDNSTVILNLEGIDMELAQRIIDFTCGSCYSLGGSLQKVSSYIFILVPSNVDITGDFTNILGGAMPSVKTGY